jgi:hypothetical protein
LLQIKGSIMPGKKDRSNISGKRRIILNLLPFALAILVLMIVKLGQRHPELIERYYSGALYPLIAKSLSSVSDLVPYSLWDIFWISVIILFLCGLILLILRTIRLYWFVLRVAQVMALFYSFFYISWGFNYFRPNIETRVGWKAYKADEKVFRVILDSLIVNTNKSFVKIRPSEYPFVERLVDDSYRKNISALGINYLIGSRHPKKMILSTYFAKSDVNGYFGPFFNEVNLNYYLYPADYPFSLAHEKAHQYGIASESEANLTAFIICTASEDRRLKYSGYMFLMLYFLNDARHMDGYQGFIKKIDKPVIEDIRFRNRYYEGLQDSTLKKIQTAANDAYLKSNSIKKGVRNYNQVVSLVISWYYNSGLLEDNK